MRARLMVAAVTVVTVATWFVARKAPEPPVIAPALAADLAGVVADTLEMYERLGTEHRAACLGNVFGVFPEDARSVADARVVYGWAYCTYPTGQDIRAGRAVEGVTALSSESYPVVLHLGDPRRLVQPGDGSYARDVRRLFPARFHEGILRQDPRYTVTHGDMGRRVEAVLRASPPP